MFDCCNINTGVDWWAEASAPRATRLWRVNYAFTQYLKIQCIVCVILRSTFSSSSSSNNNNNNLNQCFSAAVSHVVNPSAAIPNQMARVDSLVLNESAESRHASRGLADAVLALPRLMMGGGVSAALRGLLRPTTHGLN